MRYLNDRPFLSGRAVSSQRLITEEYPIELDPARYKGAWVVTESGTMHYSTGEEWLASGPPRVEVMIPPWASVPEGWFRTGLSLPSPLGNRELVTNKFDFNYVQQKMVGRYQPALGKMWTTYDRSVQVTSPGDLIGSVEDLTGLGHKAEQVVSADRPLYDEYPVGHSMEGKPYFDFSALGDMFDIQLSQSYSGTLVVAMEHGIYDVGYSSTGAVGFGYGGTDPVYEVFFFDEALSVTELQGFKDFLESDSGHVKDNFAAKTDWSNTFKNMDYITSAPDVDMSSADSVGGLFEGCSSLQSVPQYDWTNVTSADSTFANCGNMAPMPAIDMPNCSLIRDGWQNCTGLQSFPQIDLSSVTYGKGAFYNCGFTSFPAINMPLNSNFVNMWSQCSNMQIFDAGDMSSGEDFQGAWNGCSALTEFPAFVFPSSATRFYYTWNGCTLMQTFPAGAFDNVNATEFTNAFTDCGLNQQSVDNILVSINNAAQANGLTGGTLNIDGGTSAAPSTTGESAIDNLRAAGWTVTVNGGY